VRYFRENVFNVFYDFRDGGASGSDGYNDVLERWWKIEKEREGGRERESETAENDG